MASGKKKKFDLGNNGTITFHVSDDAKRLLIDFDVEEKGLENCDQPSDRRAQGNSKDDGALNARTLVEALAGSVRSTDLHRSSLPYSATE
jgi:hypothetical protein